MTKKLTISALLLISTSSLVFGFYQMQRANEIESLAIKYKQLSGDLEQKLIEQKKIAEQQEKLANHEAEKFLECSKKLDDAKGK